ncbi:MAG TPA: SIR2 family protein [Acidobacteriaceae bacterium]
MATDAVATRYASYQADVSADIAACVQGMSCQPILFIGSGLSRRYFGGPSWDELLSRLAKECPLIDRDFAYYKQSLVSPLAIGEAFAASYREWAWSTGRKSFPDSLFDEKVPGNAYIKHRIAEILSSMTPASVVAVTDPQKTRELATLQAIRPHAIITTNYDQFLELLFPDYMPIIGQQIIRSNSLSVGELFKIHGCVSQPGSLVFTSSDYDEFMRRKKYLSAKLLTYFSEHPLVFIGYGAADPNIKAILSDIDEALPETAGVIPNVYILEWRPEMAATDTPARERLIAIEGAKGVRIKAIETADFTWAFEAFGTQNNHPHVSAKLLRSLMVRSYELVRTDIPRKLVQANFEMLEHAVDSPGEFAKLFGISTIADPSVISAKYPYILTEVGKKLGFKGWNQVQPLLERVKVEKGFDLKGTDNRFHCAVKYGATTVVHKYSDESITLLKKVRDKKPYEVAPQKPSPAP